MCSPDTRSLLTGEGKRESQRVREREREGRGRKGGREGGREGAIEGVRERARKADFIRNELLLAVLHAFSMLLSRISLKPMTFLGIHCRRFTLTQHIPLKWDQCDPGESDAIAEAY
jgi:hypothetical protein